MPSDPGRKRLSNVRYRELLALAPYRRFAFGEIASALGDGIGLTAVPWLALALAPPGFGPIAVGVAIAAYSVPGALSALPAARLVRRWSPARLILADTVTRLLGLSAIAILGLLGRLFLPEFVVLLAVSSLLHPWGQGGRAGLVPLLVPESHRLAGNSFLFTSANAALTIVGPGVGGVLVATIGAAPAIAVDAASFFALLIALASLGLRATRDDLHSEADHGAVHAQLLRGPLAFLLALTVVFYGLYGPFEVALPLYIRTNLHAGPELFGFAWAAFGAGALVGGLVGGAILDVRSRVALMRFSVYVVAGWGIAVFVLALVPVAGVLLAAIAIGGAIYAPYPSVVTTLQQRVVAPTALPAVATAFAAISGGVAFTATGVGGPIVVAVGPRATLIASGAATVLLAGAVALSAILWRSQRVRAE